MTIYRPPRLITPAARRASRKIEKHPKFGGSTGYSVAQRLENITLKRRGLRCVASARSIRRWKLRILPYAPTGNKNCLKLNGIFIYLLVLYRNRHPKCNADEMRAFLYRSVIPRVVFSRSDIYLAEKNLNIVRKKASTTAFQALLPANIQRRRQFWTLPPPVGVQGVDRMRLIDCDECAFYLQICNRPYGKAFVCERVRETGVYGHDLKFTLILAIDCHGFKHAQLLPVAGKSHFAVAVICLN